MALPRFAPDRQPGAGAVVGLFIASVLVLGPGNVYAQSTSSSGLPVPRFVSIKSNPVNLRKGPGTKYPRAWIFRQAGLPVEVIREHKRWRQVRDSEGATGWVLRTLLSSRRTALVLPWERSTDKRADNGQPEVPLLVSLRASASSRGRARAKLEAGTLVGIRSCDGRWCYVSIDRFRGYIEQQKLWGVYPKEIVR